MLDEDEPKILRDRRNESMAFEGKVLTCKVFFHKDASNLMTCATTIDFLNIVVMSLEKKCNDIYHTKTNLGFNSSEDDIIFPSLMERWHIVTYYYPLMIFQTRQTFIIAMMFNITLQQEG